MMIIKFNCDICGKEMKQPWTALSTPADVYRGSQASVHFCEDCSNELFNKLFKWMNEVKTKEKEE